MLKSESVQTLMRLCLAEKSENPDVHIINGITRKFAFNPKVIEENADQIENLVKELPDPFMMSKGGGWSFLQACQDKHGNQWTGSHAVMEELFCLGMAAGKVKCVFEDRELWTALPGGMPYYVVLP